jgi:hypothetical protein
LLRQACASFITCEALLQRRIEIIEQEACVLR